MTSCTLKEQRDCTSHSHTLRTYTHIAHPSLQLTHVTSDLDPNWQENKLLHIKDTSRGDLFRYTIASAMKITHQLHQQCHDECVIQHCGLQRASAVWTAFDVLWAKCIA